MIVLDTNVISELMKAAPAEGVVAWLDRQPGSSIWTTSVCVFEVWMGLNQMGDGRRRQALETCFQQVLQEDLAGRVLGFDTLAAQEAAIIAARLRTAGQPVEIRDGLIAGIIASRRGTLATRNLRHFANTGIPLVNPWEDQPGA